jgi:hypothetical protein
VLHAVICVSVCGRSAFLLTLGAYAGYVEFCVRTPGAVADLSAATKHGAFWSARTCLWDTSASADPLMIEVEGSCYPGESIRGYFEESLEAWRDWRTQEPAAGPFVLPLGPDRIHKQNASGGPPYGVVVPDGCVDGLFVSHTTMPFVSRHAGGSIAGLMSTTGVPSIAWCSYP